LCVIAVAVLGAARAEEGGDRRLREQIAARLEGQVSLHLRDLKLEVSRGDVRVSGTVASLEEVDTVERLVQGIVGVRRLDNRVRVRPSPRSDAAIGQELRRRLDRFTALRSPAVEAEVTDGHAVLSGTVGEAVDRVEAERQARSVPGVLHLDNRLAVRGPVWSGDDSGVGGEDLAVRVRSLLANPLTFGAVRRLRVEAEGSTIYLHGAVAREADREEAGRLAATVSGVTRVVNLIAVDPA
jgi:osmotically-inducible protein OsmY